MTTRVTRANRYISIPGSSVGPLGGLAAILAGLLSVLSPFLGVGLAAAGLLATMLLLFPEAAVLAIVISRPLLDAFHVHLPVPGFTKGFGPSEFVAGFLAVGGLFVIAARRIDVFKIPLTVPFAGLLVVAMASFAESSNLQLSVIALLRLLAQFTLFVLVYSYLRRESQLNRLVLAIIVSAVPPVLWGFTEIATGSGHAFRPGAVEGLAGDRLGGPFGTGLTVGIFLIVPTTLCFIRTLESKFPSNLGFAAILALLSVAMYFTFARTAWLALASIVLIVPAVRYRMLLPVVPLVAIVAILVVPGITQRFAPVFTDTSQTTVAGRLDRWGGAVEVFRSHPLLGAGIGVGDLLAGEEAADKASPTHSDYFRVLADMGLPGLFAYVWLVLACGWEGVKAFKRAGTDNHKSLALAFCAIWVGFLFIRLTSNVLTHQVFQYYFWSLAAATFALARITPDASKDPQ